MLRPSARAQALLLAVAALLALATAPTRADEVPHEPATTRVTRSFLIVNPSGRGSQSLAQGFLGDLAAAITRAWKPESGAPPALAGRYHVTEADALASIRRDKPVFALVSPGFYLAHRQDLQLTVLLKPVRAHGEAVVHLVTSGSAATGAIREGHLTGLRIGGQLAGEPRWLLGPVLGALVGSGTPPRLAPVSTTLAAVRDLRAGKLDAVVMHDSDWALLASTGKASGLSAAWTSAPLPEGPVVTFPGREDLGRSCAAALRALDTTLDGRKVLERMTLSGFAPATDADYASLPPLAKAAAATGASASKRNGRGGSR